MTLDKMTIKEILNSYALPHKFLVRFALFCANDVKHLLKDQRSLKALDVVELWLEDKATDKDIANVIYDAYTAAANATYAATNAAYAATNAAYAAAYATHAAHYADYAATNGTYAAANAHDAAYAYKSRLISMINELTLLEQELYRR